MNPKELIAQRFQELHQQQNEIRYFKNRHGFLAVDIKAWETWATSVLNLFQRAFGTTSVHYSNFKALYDKFQGYQDVCDQAKGVFAAAKTDFEGGYMFSLEAAVSGEIFGDFVTLAKEALREGHKDVAAVLACASLEDALKRYARVNDLNVDDEVMQKVVGALKSKGLVSGARKALLDSMPKIRDYAMHANWDKITPEDVSSIIGFVEQFLIENF